MTIFLFSKLQVGSIKCQHLSPQFGPHSLKNVKHFFRNINCETLLYLQTRYFNLRVAAEEPRLMADFCAPHCLYLKTIQRSTGERKDGQILICLKIPLKVVTLLMFLFRFLCYASSSFHPETTPLTSLVCLLSPCQEGGVVFLSFVFIFKFCFIIQSDWLCEILWPGGN